MKAQTEILSYLFFTAIVLSLSSIFLYYFFTFRETFSRYINKMNIYSMVNVFESPIIIFSSICSFCRVEILFQINHTKPLEQFFIIENYSDRNETKAKYEEVRSRENIISSILNLNKNFNFDLYAISAERIVFSLDKFRGVISAKNS